jgi:hypothetical protein
VQIFYSRLASRYEAIAGFGQSQLTAKLVDRRAQWCEGNYLLNKKTGCDSYVTQ